jgi:hypothetical protein
MRGASGQQEGAAGRGRGVHAVPQAAAVDVRPAKPDKAFATPRTWEKALTYYADPRCPSTSSRRPCPVRSVRVRAAEFWGFVDVWAKMPKMSDIEANPDKVPVPEEAAMRYAVSVAISGTMTPKNTAPFAPTCSGWTPSSVCSLAAGAQARPDVCGTKEFIDFSKKYRAIFAR